MLKIFIAGATGTIGKEVVRELAAREAHVIVGCRDPGKAAAQFGGLRVELRAFDLERPETLDAALSGVDKLLIINPITKEMAAQTRALVEAASRASVKHIVRSSVLGADAAEPILEGIWHGASDAIVRTSGIPYTILRPNQYLQNFISPNNAETVRTQGAIYLPLADARVSNIDTRDIAAVAANVLLQPGDAHHGKEYDLTGGESVSMDELTQAIGTAIGKPVRYVAVTEEQTRGALLQFGLPEIIADAILGWFDYCRRGLAARVHDDAARLLGRPPRTLQQFAADYAERFR